jgi:hypothetical protein
LKKLLSSASHRSFGVIAVFNTQLCSQLAHSSIGRSAQLTISSII